MQYLKSADLLYIVDCATAIQNRTNSESAYPHVQQSVHNLCGLKKKKLREIVLTVKHIKMSFCKNSDFRTIFSFCERIKLVQSKIIAEGEVYRTYQSGSGLGQKFKGC